MRKKFKNVFLHIGCPKTGSTAIQMALDSNREALEKNGILYPMGETHGELGAYFYDFNSKGKYYFDKICTQIDQTDAHTLVLSSESFIYLSIDVLSRFYDWLEDYAENLVAICYVRDALSNARSMIGQGCRSGYVHAYDIIGSPPILFFKDFLKNYVSIFGKDNILVRPYRRQYSTNGDIVANFVGLIDENLLINLSQDSDSLKVNESLGEVSARLCIAIAKLSNPNLNLTIFGNHYGRILKDIPSRAISLTTSQAEYIIELARPHFEYLFENFNLYLEPDWECVNDSPLVLTEETVNGLANLIAFNVPSVIKPTALISNPVGGVEITSKIPNIVFTNSPVECALTIYNLGEDSWMPDKKFPVRVGYFWRSDTDKIINESRLDLPSNGIIQAKDSLQLNLCTTSPNESGRYILNVSLVQDTVCWFHDNGNHFKNLEIHIEVR